LHVLDICNDNDVPLFTKKTFAAGQPPTTPRKPTLRQQTPAINAGFQGDCAGFSLD
jgi:hypothetical protein